MSSRLEIARNESCGGVGAASSNQPSAPVGVRSLYIIVMAMVIMALTYVVVVHVMDYRLLRSTLPWTTPMIGIGRFVFCALWIAALIGTAVAAPKYRFGLAYTLWMIGAGLYVLVFGARLLIFIGPALP
jgi:uncharacterized protein YhhL (DUF1145 family)